jgi:Protein of unknown function (DUF3499)
VTSSGSEWSPRYGSQYRRLCARAGCSALAVATLRFQSTERQAWLVELDDNSARTQGDLCARHAAALVLPRGWELHDERAAAASAVVRPAEEPTPAKRGGRRVRARRRAAAENVEAAPPETDALPGVDPEPVAGDDRAGDAGAPRGAPAQFGANDDDSEVVDDALDAILDARTPLLRRAFRNARPE